MAAFKSSKELFYEGSVDDTLSDVEKALTMIGKVKKTDHETKEIWGSTRCGLQKVNIYAQVADVDGKTKISLNGKSDDIKGIGAQKGIDNLIDTLNNVDNIDYTPSKTAGYSPQLIIATILELILAPIIILGQSTLGLQSSVIIVLTVIWFIIFAYILISRFTRKIKKK